MASATITVKNNEESRACRYGQLGNQSEKQSRARRRRVHGQGQGIGFFRDGACPGNGVLGGPYSWRCRHTIGRKPMTLPPPLAAAWNRWGAPFGATCRVKARSVTASIVRGRLPGSGRPLSSARGSRRDGAGHYQLDPVQSRPGAAGRCRYRLLAGQGNGTRFWPWQMNCRALPGQNGMGRCRLTPTRAIHTIAPERSAATLVSGIIADAQHLIGQQLAMFRQEIQDEFRKVMAGRPRPGGRCRHHRGWQWDAALDAAAAAALPCPSCLCGPCFGIVGGVLAAVGGILAFVGVRKIRSCSPLANQAVEAFKENFTWTTHPK